jgi:hypothetical protein
MFSALSWRKPGRHMTSASGTTCAGATAGPPSTPSRIILPGTKTNSGSSLMPFPLVADVGSLSMIVRLDSGTAL